VDERSPGSAALVLVGDPGVVHVGAHLDAAARAAGLSVALCDVRAAFDGPAWLRRLSWRVGGHRPPRLRQFSQHVLSMCRAARPEWLLTTGLAPLEPWAVTAIGELGIRRLNYLTDDPCNPAHAANWFLAGLSEYDQVFTPRRANMADLRGLGCREVAYLPFAYAPEVHFPEPPTEAEASRFAADVVFVGGADRDRVPVMSALARAGFRLGLWGGYWERHPGTRAYARGHADPPTVRRAIGGAKVALCLVRRANRDGHAMRSFEVPAIGACMLVEDTDEHRELFGSDGEAVVYFQTLDEAIDRLRWLLAHESERRRLSAAAHRRVIGGENTYGNRLAVMLGSGVPAASAA
jgi:spore maturation protein CgeB